MKSVKEMDLDEWEMVSDDDGGTKIYSPTNTAAGSVLEMNYFNMCPPPRPHTKELDADEGKKEEMRTDSGFHKGSAAGEVWKRGKGAICSFGVAAAATFCILLFNNTHQNHLRIQIYTTTPKATRLNEEAMRGLPTTTARITCGGYYDAAASNSKNSALDY